jgi:nucleotide-binding universal stress UspA family protein
MYKHLLVPTDGSKLSLKALDTAMGIARALDAKITVLTVTPSYPPIYAGDGFVLEPLTAKEWKGIYDKKNASLKADVDKRVGKLQAGKAYPVAVNFVPVADNDTYQAIINAAKKLKCDLIVMASHGRRGVSALLMGSETTKVLTHSKIPVLVCR